MKQSIQESDVVPALLPTPFAVGPVNAFLIRREPLTLVDTGPKDDRAYEALASILRGHGVEMSDLQAILLTHGHVDHIGLLSRIADASGASVYAHPYVASQCTKFEQDHEHARRFLSEILREFGAPPKMIQAALRESETVRTYASFAPVTHVVNDQDAMIGFTAYHVPGHSPSDTLFVDHGSGIAFTGDHILKGVNPNPLIRRPRPEQPRPKSLLEYRASLLRSRSLDLRVCYPGHGDPIRDHRAAIDRILQRQDRRTSQVRELLTHRDLTPFELSAALFPKLDPGHTYFGLSVAVGHLEILEEDNEATAELRDGVLHYTSRSPYQKDRTHAAQ